MDPGSLGSDATSRKNEKWHISEGNVAADDEGCHGMDASKSQMALRDGVILLSRK
jgi:hypothetical protein